MATPRLQLKLTVLIKMEIVWPIEYYSHVGVSNTTTNVYVGGPDWYSVEFICNFDARTIIASSGTELAFCRDNCYVRVLGGGSRRHRPRFKCTLLRACSIIENSLGKSYGMIRYKFVVKTSKARCCYGAAPMSSEQIAKGK